MKLDRPTQDVVHETPARILATRTPLYIQDQSILMRTRFPIEIRLIIYDILSWKDTIQILHPCRQRGLIYDFLATCRQARDEVLFWYTKTATLGARGSKFTGGFAPNGLRWILDLKDEYIGDWDIAMDDNGDYRCPNLVTLPSLHGYWIEVDQILFFFPTGFNKSTCDIWTEFHANGRNLHLLEHLVVDLRSTTSCDTHRLLIDNKRNLLDPLHRIPNLRTVELIVDQPSGDDWYWELLEELPIAYWGPELNGFMIRFICRNTRQEEVVKFERVVVQGLEDQFVYMLHPDLLEDESVPETS